MLKHLILYFLFIISFQIIHAKLFTNSYVSFQLPDNWQCRLEVTEWICTSRYNEKSREAIIVLTAKEIGPADKLNIYESHLKQPKPGKLKNGQPALSQVLQVKKQMINNHPWIDGLHLSSEVQYYYTRYLATVKPPVAVLVTFSAHRKMYTKYSSDFMKAIQSLRVTAKQNILTSGSRTKESIGGSDQTFGPPVGDGGLSLNIADIPEEDNSTDFSLYIGLAVLLASIAAYFFFKNRK
jgi:hypothetical protein